MKRTFRIAFLCTVLVFACLFTTACSKPPALEKEKDGFRNPKTDILYSPAEPNYRAQPPVSGDAYARIKTRKGMDDTLLYEIDGVDPERYLVSDSYTVYCAKGAELPDLFDLPCNRIGIYDTQVSSNDGNITAAAEIAALKDLHKNGIFTSLNNLAAYFEMTKMNADWYDLRFMGSGEYSGIYYQLKYVVCPEDVIITEWVENPDDFHDFYPGIPFETEWRTYDGADYFMADYNFGRELLVDDTTGRCYVLDNSLLSYITPQQDAN